MAGSGFSILYGQLAVSVTGRRHADAAPQSPKPLAQVGHFTWQPVSSTEFDALTPGTGFCTVNMLSGSPLGGWASPTKTVLMSSWSPARNSGLLGWSATSGGSLKPLSACASLTASTDFSWLATSAKL